MIGNYSYTPFGQQINGGSINTLETKCEKTKFDLNLYEKIEEFPFLKDKSLIKKEDNHNGLQSER